MSENRRPQQGGGDFDSHCIVSAISLDSVNDKECELQKRRTSALNFA